MDQLVWILLIIFLSCFIQAFTGFGSALVSVPLLLSFMPLEQVVPLVVMYCLLLQLVVILQLKSQPIWKEAFILGGMAILGAPFGTYLGKALPQNIALTILGAILAIYGMLLFFEVKMPKFRGVIYPYIFGFSSGLLAGAYSTSAPPLIIYSSSQDWPQSQFKATLQAAFFMGTFSVIVTLLIQGSISNDIAWVVFKSIPVIFIGVFIGVWLGNKLNSDQFRKIVYILISILGIKMVL
ncbi:MAG: sulfite exporter TauE/SafE family protein [Lentisphaeria bacterium]|nr:sulfite exporter TauE/SafE family protein [Lentisphaeria bacterium]